MKVRTFSEMRRFDSFEDRFKYLKLDGSVGAATFGFDRYMNQKFYRSRAWKQIRDHVIIRDNGCDLGVEGYEIHERILIHHMNPMTSSDLIHGNEDVLNPDFLISVTHATHNAIHYGDTSLLRRVPVERTPGDTNLWSRRKV